MVYTVNRFITKTEYSGKNSYQSSTHFISMLSCPNLHVPGIQKGGLGNQLIADIFALLLHWPLSCVLCVYCGLLLHPEK